MDVFLIKTKTIMEIKETTVTESQLKMVTELFVSDNAKINLEAEDVRKIVVGRTGVMYEASQEALVRSEFMKGFFVELSVKKQVKESTHLLICIDEDQNDKLTMMDIMSLSDFMSSLGKDVDMLWAVNTNTSGNGITIRVLSMR